MDDMIERRIEVCANHPKQQQIFHLEKMLLEAGFPYYFNFWEELRPTPFNQEGLDPESIDWDNYHFCIEFERGAGMEYPLMSVEIDSEGLLFITDMRPAAAQNIPASEIDRVSESYNGLTSEQAMEIIEEFFNSL